MFCYFPPPATAPAKARHYLLHLCRAQDSEENGGRFEYSGPVFDERGRRVRIPQRSPELQAREKLLRVSEIIRPLAKTRSNDQAKVAELMESIAEIGQQVPVDVLEVQVAPGVVKYYGFSGCHRFEAHQRLGRETIRAYVYKASLDTLKAHLS